jgi:hypothetical protein
MRKLLNNRWFVAALALAAIALIWSSLAPEGKTGRVAVAPAPSASVAEAAAEPSADEAIPLSAQTALKQLIIAKSSRDPFALRTSAEPVNIHQEKEEPDLLDSAHLTGVWTQNGTTLVLINDHIRNIGDSIGRLTIESASQEGIWLTHWKGRTFLALGKSYVLRTPARQPMNISSK